MNYVLTTLLALVAITSQGAPLSSVYDVRSYGAVGDGQHLATASINDAISACAKAGGGTVTVPPGRYLTGTITLKSNVTLNLDSGAILLGSENANDYAMVTDVWIPERKITAPLIYAEDADNITVTGRGLIDGQGKIWWQPVLDAKAKKIALPEQTQSENGKIADLHNRPQLIRFVRCHDVVIEHINLRNAPEWNIHPLLCENVRVDGVTIFNPVPSPNTDGIDPESCRNVQIVNCRVDTGDDCITLKSGLNELGRRLGKPNENITIMNCVLLHGHGGVTIGSEMSGGVRNVTVSNCVFQGTDNGIRIKSQRGRGGIVEGVTASNLVMQDVPHPFTITTFYMGKDKPGDVFPVDEGTPTFRDFVFSNISARGARDAGSITGLRELPIENISFTNVHIQASNGFSCTNTKQIAFHDVTIDTDGGAALTLKNATEIDTAGLHTRKSHLNTPLIASEAIANQ